MENDDDSDMQSYRYRTDMERVAIRDQISAARHTLPESLLAAAAIPAWLVGTHKEVSLRARKLFRQAMKEASWDRVTNNATLVPIDETPGDLILGGSEILIEGEHVQLNCVPEAMMAATRDHHLLAQRDLFIRGLEHFWFCLATLRGVHVLPHRASAEEKPSFARRALPKYLRWWPIFTWLDRRFWKGGGRGWPRTLWAGVPLGLCQFLGVSDANLTRCLQQDARTVGELIAGWTSDPRRE
jgi:hypothetical protein